MEEYATKDWTMGAYIVNKKINEHAIEVRGSSTIGIDVR
jgi:hypothetical protein